MPTPSPALAAPTFDLPPRLRTLAHRLVGHMLVEDGDLVTRWRARLTAAFMLAIATFGLIPIVPTLAVTIRRGLWMITVVDATLFVLTLVMLLSRRVSNRARSIFLVAAAYAVGVMAVTSLGPASGTLAWLYTGVLLCAFLLGPRATALLGGAIVLLLATVAIGIPAGWFAWAEGNPGALDGWLLTSVNFLFLISIFALANGVVMRLLEREERGRIDAEARLAEARRHEALGALAGGIAHDFNNLLVPVLVHVGAVREALVAPRPDAAELRAALGEAQQAAERARELVQRILAFGRGLPAERSVLDPAGAAREAVAFARLTAPPNVTIDASDDGAPRVRASAVELHQVLHNLVSNAVHAVGETGTVHVHVDRVADATGRWARLRVRDDGAGMDAHTRARIFDPYFSTKAPGKGTGLGLPIVRSLVDALGGQIHIESAPGAGTTFTLLLPESDPTSDAAGPTPVHTVSARTEPASSPTSHAEASAAAHGATSPARRILLVDDEESVRRATARLLESLGHSVTAVASADAALDALHAAPGTFGLLLTDFRMPGASGAELARTVRARDVALPIVLMSGHIDDAERDGAPPAGIGRLQKPFTRAELAAAITAMPDAVHDGAAAA